MICRLLLACSLLLTDFLKLEAQTSQDYSQLWNDLLVLSHDSLEGRKTATIGSKKAQNYISSRYQQIGLETIGNKFSHHFTPSRFSLNTDTATNLIGYLPGSSDQIILITAHYDHLGVKNGQIYNGADDNASGVSIILFLAQYFIKAKTTHSLLFVAYDAEELGLLGAKAFIKDPPVDLERIILNINLDMVSRSSNNQIYACGVYHYPFLGPYLSAVDHKGPVQLLLGHDEPESGKHDWTYSSDHGPFHRRGVPFLYFGVEDHADYHRSSDTVDKIDQEFFFDVARLILESTIRLDKGMRFSGSNNDK